jgi:hypothetical protein
MAKSIELEAHYGDTIKKVVVTNPPGGGSGYHVYIDKRYNGSVVKYKGEWVGHLNPKSDLQTADIDILGEIIDSKFKAD